MRNRWQKRRTSSGGQIGAAPADELLETYRQETGVQNFSVRLLKEGESVFSRDVGDYGPATIIPIASASKWLVGATVAAQIDAGRMNLSDMIGEYIPGLPTEYNALRLDQLLSFTAGLPSLREFIEFRQPKTISLERSAQLAAATPLASRPGEEFDYGGANLQFIGAAIEKVNGKSWREVFERDIANPLGMNDTLWGRMREEPARGQDVSNPVLQAGCWTTASDYSSFLTMIAENGVYGGRRIISEVALRQISEVKTIGVRMGFAAPANEGESVEYMIAHWCEHLENGNCKFESSPGFYGTYPWIDRDTGLYGIIFQRDQLQRIRDEAKELRDSLIGLFA